MRWNGMTSSSSSETAAKIVLGPNRFWTQLWRPASPLRRWAMRETLWTRWRRPPPFSGSYVNLFGFSGLINSSSFSSENEKNYAADVGSGSGSSSSSGQVIFGCCSIWTPVSKSALSFVEIPWLFESILESTFNLLCFFRVFIEELE